MSNIPSRTLIGRFAPVGKASKGGLRADRIVSATLALILAANTGLHAQAPADAEKKDEEVKLEKFEVTGSRIKRLDAETPSPVVVLTRQTLETTGFSNLGDALRALPFVQGQSITAEGSSTGFAAGTSSVNLRGLGNNNTLILINGRRAVPSGAGVFNGFQAVVDINSIPTKAIESMDIVKDGASAIYGSDAVAGVLNIKLRKEYNGLSTEVTVGNTLDTDSLEKSAFAIAGATNKKTSITITADFYHRNPIANRDIKWNKTADYRQNKTSTGQVEISPDGDHYTGIDWRSTSNYPARFFLPGTSTTANLRSFAAPTSDPNPANAQVISRATGVGFYDFQQVSWMRGQEESRGFTAFMKHDFTDNLYAFADLSYRRFSYLIAAAAAPFTTTDKGAGTNNRLLVPADNPFNPYGNRYFPGAGRDIELSTFRLVNAGPRYTDADSDYPRYVAGLGGNIGDDWSWESYFMRAEGSFSNKSPGTAFDSRVQEALRGVIIDGVKLYANPFGPEDARITDYYSGTNPNRTQFTAETLSVSASGSVFTLPAGDIGLAIGGESRRDRILDVRTLENENGNVVGGSEGFGYQGAREVKSAYAEVNVPIFRSLEGQAAVRFEDYSDFGNTTKPKFALKYRVTPWLLLRSSYSQSFKAPDLAFLLSKGSVSFTSSQLFDPKRPDLGSAQIKTLGRGNPNLKPEETDTYYVGAVIDIEKGLFKGVSLEVAGFRYEQQNLITRDTAAFTLTNEDRLPAGSVVRQPLTADEIASGVTTGRIDYINTDWFNANSFTLEGMDIAAYYQFPTTRIGDFKVGVEATWIGTAERESVSSVGTPSVVDVDSTYLWPAWRGNGRINWRFKDWSASVYIDYVGAYPNPDYPTIHPYIRVNPQVSYAGFLNTKITVGARNVFNERPPFDLSTGSDAYAAGVHNPEPIFLYARISREF